jgi:mono/diheme cytochrome c family protein
MRRVTRCVAPRALTPGVLAGALLAAHGCSDCDLNRMIDQPRYTSYEACEVCPAGTIMLQPPEGAVARGAPPAGELATGRGGDGAFFAAIPLDVDRRVLARGRDRFDVFCAACHGRLGDGRSQVAENMKLRRPPSLVAPPYTDYPPGRIFTVITYGFGLMRSYAGELPLDDRWAVVAYVQVLQLSQHAPLAELPPAIREEAAPWLR